jgi:hypothetical protein
LSEAGQIGLVPGVRPMGHVLPRAQTSR